MSNKSKVQRAIEAHQAVKKAETDLIRARKKLDGCIRRLTIGEAVEYERHVNGRKPPKPVEQVGSNEDENWEARKW